jgi:hypothetical protein
MNLIDRAKSIKGGIAILYEWAGGGGIVVSKELAQTRTDTCLKCPLNQGGCIIEEVIARAIKNQVSLKNKLGLKTKGIKSLKTCAACDCYLPLKIWLPLANILPEPEQKDKFDSKCWLLHESL